jgi:hypothetical protein
VFEGLHFRLVVAPEMAGPTPYALRAALPLRTRVKKKIDMSLRMRKYEI